MTELHLEDAEPGAHWVATRPQVIFFEASPDPTGRTARRVHLAVQALDGSDRRQLTPHHVRFAQLSPDGTRLASISSDQHLIVADLATGASRVVVDDVMPARSPTLDIELPPTLQWSPDGTRILVQTAEDDRDGDGNLDRATLRLWDVATGTLVRELYRPTMEPNLFFSDGKRVGFVAPGSSGREMIAVNLTTLAEMRGQFDGAPLHVNQTPSRVLHDTAIAADGAIAAARDKTLTLTGRGAPRTLVTAPDSSLVSPAWTPDGRYLVFAARHHLYVLDTAEPRLGSLGPGIPSPLVVNSDYRPPASRVTPPAGPFDLAYRTY